MSRTRIVSLARILAITFLVVTGTPSSHAYDPPHPADVIYKPPAGEWNGWKIYLSPAHHYNGPKQGCGNYVEDDNMHLVAHSAGHITTLGQGSLVDRGYRVRIGHGDPGNAVTRSNNWGSDRHISMHSNASGQDQCGGSGRGTRVFYYPGSTNGQDLAGALRDTVGALTVLDLPTRSPPHGPRGAVRHEYACGIP